MKPIYKPSGAAKEYGDLAVNIYTGCNHRCYYCFAPSILRKSREDFSAHVEPRKNIVEEVKKQISREKITDKMVHLCFACDPYPAQPVDTSPTREIIKAIKETGNHVQILTKGGERALRDFDLLDSEDWFGVTYTGCKKGELFKKTKEEPNASAHSERLFSLGVAHRQGVNTWVSCEPVLVEYDVLILIEIADYIDKFKIGKLNYQISDINWEEFGRRCEQLCLNLGRDYYIKDSLRNEMEKLR